MKTRRFLSELRTEIERHPAVNHLFLNRVATSPFSRQDYRVLGENHFPLVCLFTSYLERLLVRAPSSEAKLWLAKVLVDEYGEGSRGEDHATLYAHFLRAAGSVVPERPDQRILAPAHAFIARHRELVSRRPFLEGLGAVGPGHEWAIPKMFEALLLGLRRAGFAEEEIQYFSLHVEQDQDHGRWLEEALASYADGPGAKEEIRRGALASLEARGQFWSGVQRAVTSFRQPRAIRPDGAKPRSLPHEVLLTAWDGFGPARALEHNVRKLAGRRLPTLTELLERARCA